MRMARLFGGFSLWVARLPSLIWTATSSCNGPFGVVVLLRGVVFVVSVVEGDTPVGKCLRWQFRFFGVESLALVLLLWFFGVVYKFWWRMFPGLLFVVGLGGGVGNY